MTENCNKQDLLDLEPSAKQQGSVECLGMTFENDEKRREYFLGKLREKLKDPEFREIEGFPIGEDEDILALSDPPYYTACPNPFIEDFIAQYGTPYDPDVPYSKEPFASDVSEGKNDPIYNAHSYHTKVPHKAIMRYILHYTEPGDIVFDGFCGTGMTGVAAQICDDRNAVISLGYQVKPDGTVLREEIDENGKKVWKPFSKMGARRAVLNDLSPAATFIAYNYNTPVDVAVFERKAKRILSEVEVECGWMYETLHVEPASSRLLNSIDFQPCNPFTAVEPTSNKTVKLTAVEPGQVEPEPASSRLPKTAIFRKDNLPHMQVSGATYAITFRTHQSRMLPDPCRTIVLNTLRYWDKQRWHLLAAVVMPDHVHIIAKPLPKQGNACWDLADILHSVKSFSANEINKLENTRGIKVWQTESYDHIIRDSADLVAQLAYLQNNPVKAGLISVEQYAHLYVADELVSAGWKPAPLGRINYTVWSDVFLCPSCTQDIVFFDTAYSTNTGKVQSEFHCPHCGIILKKKGLEHAIETYFDPILKKSHKRNKQVPAFISYSVGKKRYKKFPTKDDFEKLNKIERLLYSDTFSSHPMMHKGGEHWGAIWRSGYHFGVTHK